MSQAQSRFAMAFAKYALSLLVSHVASEQTTVFFSSHLVGEVELVASRIGILQRGALVYQGTLEALRASEERYRLLFAQGSRQLP